ncbi:MAG TPA: DUF2782 domain-containing protein [Usitatibacter sp.]|nr:DUF2782 domain-containing protein [Usitatibacter sp.]
MKRIVLAALFATACLEAAAQSGARPLPPGAVPLDAPPPPPALVQSETTLEPEVTVRTEEDRTIQEYRANGKVYMQRVTPRNGRAYVMIDQRGDGTFTRQDNTLDQGVRVPQWVLLEF